MSAHTRQNWGTPQTVLPELNLVKLQLDSYDQFLETGIAETLAEVSQDGGIEDYTGKNWALKFGAYRFGKPKYTAEQAKQKGVTYDVPLWLLVDQLRSTFERVLPPGSTLRISTTAGVRAIGSPESVELLIVNLVLAIRDTLEPSGTVAAEVHWAWGIGLDKAGESRRAAAPGR